MQAKLPSAALFVFAATSLSLLSSAALAQTPSYGSSSALTVYLALPNAEAAEAQAKLIQTPGSGAYHQFLTTQQFVSQYAPTETEIQAIESALRQLGYTIDYVFPNHLAIQVTAPTATVEQSLGIRLLPKTVNGRTGVVPSGAPQIPATLRGQVLAIGGLDTAHLAKSHTAKALDAPAPAAISGALTGGKPGYYLPADFENYYDVNPLYNDFGITGKGATIGIVTLANFNSANAYSFWKQIGLTVSQTRITAVDVDGGTAVAPSENLGEDETDLDIEESGALAPGANLRVYVSPNRSNSNFIDGFEAAASENLADTVSSSWGQPELDYYNDLTTGTNATNLLDAFHTVFLEMALQGQTVYIASGDSGSFDTVRDICSPFGAGTPTSPECTAPYSVDHPSSDPLVTAAGGTTTPAMFTFRNGGKATIPQERAWSWDYIEQAGYPESQVFASGDGGGVSGYFPLPWYQAGVSGITSTVPGQAFAFNVGDGFVTEFVVPSGYAGRNLPDLSTNADPETGFQFITGGLVSTFYGGTSFVAPQLNGITALFVEGLGKRVGQINPAIYQLAYNVSNDITAGNNWGYDAQPGYDNATGIGTLDATRLGVGLYLLQNGLVP